jgi:hypothetical protein
VAEWHPDAKRVLYPDAGDYVAGTGHRIVWHSTETKGLPTYDGTQPHFTLNPRTDDLWQHQSIAKAAKSLVHLVPPETNRAHAYQVELICYSSESVAKQVGGLAVSSLTDADYANIAKLARWIEQNAAVPSKSTVTFEHYPESAGAANGVRLTSSQWLAYEGHLGHQHVPGNVHGDPSNLDIKRVLAAPPPWKLVKDGHVYATGTLLELARWLKAHRGKVRKLGRLNLRRNR